MIDKLLIEKKLRKIEEFLQELKIIKVKNFVEFRKDVVTKRFIERNLELAIEQMVDICKHFISGLNLREPETYAECFQILSEGKVIPKKTVDTFQAMVRFRNILIHGYDGIDDAITYKLYKNRLIDFKTFISAIRNYIQKNSV
jgi:uncharacterized protein YutE (UPF0331/DUF86 family)